MHAQVCFAGLEFARWVIEGAGAGAVGDNVGKDLARMNRAFVEQANRNNTFFYDLIRAVERDAKKILLLLPGNVGHERQDILGACDPYGILEQMTAGELKGRKDLRGLGKLYARNGRPMFKGTFF